MEGEDRRPERRLHPLFQNSEPQHRRLGFMNGSYTEEGGQDGDHQTNPDQENGLVSRAKNLDGEVLDGRRNQVDQPAPHVDDRGACAGQDPGINSPVPRATSPEMIPSPIPWTRFLI